MKIAFLSDIHSNIEAFKAVLDFLEDKNIAKIFIAGDIVGYYYYADEVIDICRNRKDILCIQGNHDRDFLAACSDHTLMRSLTDKYGSSYWRAKENLKSTHMNWLENLPTKLTTTEDKVTITMAHGSIHDDNRYIYPNLDSSLLKAELSESDLTVLGHTHHTFLWCFDNKILINPGSVGQPRDQSSAASVFVFDTSNRALIPYKIKFSAHRLKSDILKNDCNNRYLTDILER